VEIKLDEAQVNKGAKIGKVILHLCRQTCEMFQNGDVNLFFSPLKGMHNDSINIYIENW